MAKHMRRDLFAAQCRAFSIRRFGVTPQNVSDAPSTEGHTAGIHKDLRGCDGPTDGQPGTECRSRCLPKRQRAFATAFAPHPDTRRLGCDIIDAQTG
jgi:hypothetical protein